MVPSVAIREGVLKSLEITREHFAALYDNTPFVSFVYDSRRLGTVRQFSDSNHIQVMVINIQAFVKDVDEDANLDEMDEEALQRLNASTATILRLLSLDPMDRRPPRPAADQAVEARLISC